MKRAAQAVALLLGHLVLAQPPLAGQSLEAGALEGVVRDSAQAPLYDVGVTLQDVSTGFSRSLFTGRGGDFDVALLPPGEYELRVERIGYRPHLVRGISVRPGQRLRLEVTLAAVSGAVDAVHVETFQPLPLAGYRFGTGQWFSRFEMAALPDRAHRLPELLRMSSVADEGRAIEGLPVALSGVSLDGIPLAAPRHPASLAAAPGESLPLSAFSGVELVTGDPDLERSGASSAHLSGLSRRGTRTLQLRTFGRWTNQALAERPGPEDPSFWSTQAGAVLSGPIIRDTASFVIGVEASRLELPFGPATLSDSLAVRVAQVASDTFGVFPPAEGEPGILRTETLDVFGRLDWQVASAHHLSARASFTSLPFVREAPGPGLSADFDARGMAVGVSVSSSFGAALSQEFRVGFDRSVLDYGTPDGVVGPATRFVAGGLSLGTSSTYTGRFEQSALRFQETLHQRWGEHRIKLGLSGDFLFHDRAYASGQAGEFLFSGADEFARGEGYFVQTVGAVPEADFSVSRFGAFVQDSWTPVTGLDLVFGVRYDVERLPVEEVVLQEKWLERTGLANTAVEPRAGGISPRGGFVWDLQGRHRVLVHGAGGIYRGSTDAGLLGELLTHDGRLEVRRGFGTFRGWPAAPGDDAVPVLGPTLTLLPSRFDSPRTLRGSLGVSWLVGAGTILHLSGAYRKTEFLPRRLDLNLLPEPVAEDQYGRPVFGSLRQQGGLLGVENGSNRRFPDFDRVAAVSLDGTSEYHALTAAVERRAGEILTVFGSYTFSRTVDNWLAGGGEGERARISPFPGGLEGEDWTEGVSDFDVPHRAVLAMEARAPLLRGLRLAALYRYRSGLPFTPGFRDGVDANGDGSSRNDPAFVDAELPGMQELLREWSCLREQVGRHAERNACRGEALHSLDARIGVDLPFPGGYHAELLLDGVNLLASGAAHPDRALYLVDPARALDRDSKPGTVIVPFSVNPGFGQPLVRQSVGRSLRLGIRIEH